MRTNTPFHFGRQNLLGSPSLPPPRLVLALLTEPVFCCIFRQFPLQNSMEKDTSPFFVENKQIISTKQNALEIKLPKYWK